MSGLSVSVALPATCAMFLTPLLMQLWARLSPAKDLGVFEDFKALKKRNEWINSVACLFCLLAFCSPFFLFGKAINNIGWPSIGIAFGLSVMLPIIWVGIVTLPQGTNRWREFWRFYELKYKIGLRGIFIVYAVFAGLGFVSIATLFYRGIW